jgi:hypothetical protein
MISRSKCFGLAVALALAASAEALNLKSATAFVPQTAGPLSHAARPMPAMRNPRHAAALGHGFSTTARSFRRREAGLQMLSAPLAFSTSSIRALGSTPDLLFQSIFIGLACTALLFKVLDRDNSASGKEEAPPGVRSLQLRFLIVFWLLRMADWLQGPYFYEVYASEFCTNDRYISSGTHCTQWGIHAMCTCS